MVSQGIKKLEGLSTLTRDEREAISEFADLLRKRYGSLIREIILFGSKVKGESGKDSDIDILIVLTSLSWEMKKTISEIAAEENIKHNVIISTIRYNVDTWDDPVIKASPFGTAVRTEGIWL